MRKLILVTWLINLFALHVSGQKYNTAIMPVLNFNKKITDEWKANVKIKNQTIFSSDGQNFSLQSDPRYKRTDLEFSATRKLTYKNSLTGGMMVRLNNEKPTKRLSLSFSTIRQLRRIILAQRMGIERIFKPDNKKKIRLRYRLATALPLNGEHIDPNESYLKLSNEYIGSKESSNTLEIRILAAFGHETIKGHKIETGLDYRLSDIGTKNHIQTIWLYLGWFLNW